MSEHDSYACWMPPCPESDTPLLRELLSYEMLCPVCCLLVRRPDWHTLEQFLPPSALHWSRQVEWPWAVREARLERHHECLEVGGSWTVLKHAVARRCRRLTCLDTDTDGDMGKARMAADAMPHDSANVQWVKGDVRELPYPDGWFDRVFCVSVLEHIESDRVGAVREMARVLRPGGVLLLTFDVAPLARRGETPQEAILPDMANHILGTLGLRLPDRETELHLADVGGVLTTAVLVRYMKP